jgi:hypothetical protein
MKFKPMVSSNALRMPLLTPTGIGAAEIAKLKLNNIHTVGVSNLPFLSYLHLHQSF